MSFGGLFDEGWGAGFVADAPLGCSAMPAGAISQPLLSRPLNKPMFSSSSLSLALQTSKDGQREMSRVTVAAGGGGGGIDSAGRDKKEDENESKAESDNLGGVSGDDDQDQNPPKKKQRYGRHTPDQILGLEALFKESPHPDEKQRLGLSRRIGLDTRQVKFWFQNRRTQMKTQLERHENSILRQENEKLRAENISIREAIRNPICSNCGGPAVLGEAYPVEHQVKIENARLRDELDRVCSLAGKFLGRPVSPSVPPIPPSMWSSSLELAVGSNGFATMHSVTDFVAGVSSPLSTVLSPPARTGCSMSGVDGPLERSMLLDLALSAMDELVKMAHMNEPLWVPSIDDGSERLNYKEYQQVIHHCTGMKPAEFVSEATRETGMVILNSSALVETLIDVARWADMFPAMIARASTTDVISSGMGGTRNGALQLMHAELQVLSPLVPIREVNFLRFCKQLADGVWAIVDVSIDAIRDSPSALTGSMKCRRMPSGCLVEDMPNGYSKVTWVEHAEYDEAAVHPLYRPMLRNGMGLGARRWVAALQRQCECLAVLMSSCVPSNDPPGMMTASGRRSMLKLAQRMTSSFCAGVCASSAREWSRLSAGGIGEDVRVMTRQSADEPGEPPGVVLSAATSVWLRVPPGRLFDFLRDDSVRSEWDILSHGGPMREMAHIAKGQDPGNAVSLRATAVSGSQGSNMLILQETCAEAAGWMVVYAPVDALAINLVIGGGDPGCVALLPSGFAVLADGPPGCPGGKAAGGALLTVAFQILVNSLPTAKLTMESVNDLISCTVQKIKAALRCCEN